MTSLNVTTITSAVIDQPAKLSGQVSGSPAIVGGVLCGSMIVNDWQITITEIEGGHRLTATRGTEVQSMDIMDGEYVGDLQSAIKQYFEENPLTINGELPDENGNFIVNALTDVEIAALASTIT